MTRIRMNQVPMWAEERWFTKWLKDNIHYVGEIINKNIVYASDEEKESSEYGKGKYPVDILAIDENNEKIIIENQYFLSNHVHLGEIITYAAWHNVSSVVWITEDIDEEHFRAVEFLNSLAQYSSKEFKFWILLVSPDEHTYLTDKPTICLREAKISDCMKKNVETNLPQNADLNKKFWDEFTEKFPDGYGFTISRAKRTDCINMGWGKSYNMNIPFRKFNIKIEIQFKQNKEIYFESIQRDFDEIEKEMQLGSYDKMSLSMEKKYSQIRIEIPAQVKNIDKWDEYIEKMVRIIIKLREIADRYEFCY